MYRRLLLSALAFLVFSHLVRAQLRYQNSASAQKRQQEREALTTKIDSLTNVIISIMDSASTSFDRFNMDDLGSNEAVLDIIRQFESANRALEIEIEWLKADTALLHAQIRSRANIRPPTQSSQNQIQEMQRIIADLNEEIVRINSNLSNSEAVIKNLRDSEKELLDRNSLLRLQLNDSINAKNIVIGGLKTSISYYQDTVKEQRGTIKNIRKKNHRLTTNLGDARDSISHAYLEIALLDSINSKLGDSLITELRESALDFRIKGAKCVLKRFSDKGDTLEVNTRNIYLLIFKIDQSAILEFLEASPVPLRAKLYVDRLWTEKGKSHTLDAWEKPEEWLYYHEIPFDVSKIYEKSHENMVTAYSRVAINDPDFKQIIAFGIKDDHEKKISDKGHLTLRINVELENPSTKGIFQNTIFQNCTLCPDLLD